MPLPEPHITRYQRWLREQRALHFDSYDALWRWSVGDLQAFWASIWDYFDIQSPTPYQAPARCSVPAAKPGRLRRPKTTKGGTQAAWCAPTRSQGGRLERAAAHHEKKQARRSKAWPRKPTHTRVTGGRTPPCRCAQQWRGKAVYLRTNTPGKAAIRQQRSCTQRGISSNFM